jgi:glycosyltransferase involved in cell wall biosynthesis
VLTVAVDATPLIGDRTGVGVAVSGLLRELATRRGLSLVGFGLTTRGWRLLGGSLPQGVRQARGPMPAGALLRVWGHVEHPTIELWTGPVDVAHGTNFVVPPSRGAGRVVYVHDLTPVRYPELCTPTSLRYPHLIGRALDRGAWVHTGSNAVAAEIVDHFGADPARVRVIPPGVDVGRGAPAGQRPIPDAGQQGVPGSRPYILAVGRTEPRKDFLTLVEAFGLVGREMTDLDLRIVGPPGWSEPALDDAISKSPLAARIIRTGWLTEVRDVMASAALLAYPSIYEGFGFPPLEAMSLGVPVVATRGGAVEEVTGGAGELVPAGDADALAAAILRVMSDSTLRARMVADGRARAQTYTWAAAGDAMEDLYRDVAGSAERAR